MDIIGEIVKKSDLAVNISVKANTYYYKEKQKGIYRQRAWHNTQWREENLPNMAKENLVKKN